MKISKDVQELIGWGLFFLCLGLGVGGCNYLENKGRALVIQAQQQKETKR